MLKGDCNKCINKYLSENSVICTECGLSRKNFVEEKSVNYYVNIKEVVHVILDYIGTEDFNKALSCLHNDVCSGFMGGLETAIGLMMDNRCPKYIIKETKNDS